MIHASTTKPRTMLDWKEHVKSKEDYDRILKSGVAYVVFGDDFPDWSEVEKYLEGKDEVQ